MDSYKIKTPTEEIFYKVQLKAFQLGYKWWYGSSKSISFTNRKAIALSSFGSIYCWPITPLQSEWDNYDAPEMSWEDFLKVGEPEEPEEDFEKVEFPVKHLEANPIIGIKIDPYNQHEGDSIINKCVVLGIKIGSYIDSFSNYYCIRFNDLILRRNNTKADYLRNKCVEISTAEFLKLENLKQLLNINTEEQMSEVTLRCSKEPKNAKNLTVGDDYVGILITKDGDQVDAIRDAHYFMCTNNSGNEARYSIGLFDEPRNAPRRRAPQVQEVVIPPPPFPSFNNYLNITEAEVHILNEDRNVTLVDFGENIKIVLRNTTAGNYRNFTIWMVNPQRTQIVETLITFSRTGVNISCGISQIYNLNSAWPRIVLAVNNLAEIYAANGIRITEDQKIAAQYAIASVVLRVITRDATSLYAIMSSNNNAAGLLEFMATIDENHGEQTGTNPNSQNQIWLWILKM